MSTCPCDNCLEFREVTSKRSCEECGNPAHMEYFNDKHPICNECKIVELSDRIDQLSNNIQQLITIANEGYVYVKQCSFCSNYVPSHNSNIVCDNHNIYSCASCNKVESSNCKDCVSEKR
jgi:hypothetical protein